MERRDFLKKAGAAGLMLAAGPGCWAGKALAEESRGPEVVVAAGEKWGELVSRALAPLGGMKAFVREGERVFIKPNASFDRSPEQGSNTHPDILKEVIKLCLEAGAKSITVFDRTLADERRCYQNSGIGPMIEALADRRVMLLSEESRRYTTVKIEKGVAFRSWQFYREALEADVYLNVPVAKHHNSAKLTLGLKNILGIIGGNRGRIHWSLDQGIVDLNTVVRPTLTILDATRILVRNGPSGGNLADVEIKNMVAASTDTVAVDAWAARHLFQREPDEIGYIRLADQAGLGESDLSKIRIISA